MSYNGFKYKVNTAPASSKREWWHGLGRKIALAAAVVGTAIGGYYVINSISSAIAKRSKKAVPASVETGSYEKPVTYILPVPSPSPMVPSSVAIVPERRPLVNIFDGIDTSIVKVKPEQQYISPVKSKELVKFEKNQVKIIEELLPRLLEDGGYPKKVIESMNKDGRLNSMASGIYQSLQMKASKEGHKIDMDAWIKEGKRKGFSPEATLEYMALRFDIGANVFKYRVKTLEELTRGRPKIMM